MNQRKQRERNQSQDEKALREGRFGREYMKKTRREAKRRDKERKIGRHREKPKTTLFFR
jgi:hypothetical protein